MLVPRGDAVLLCVGFQPQKHCAGCSLLYWSRGRTPVTGWPFGVVVKTAACGWAILSWWILLPAFAVAEQTVFIIPLPNSRFCFGTGAKQCTGLQINRPSFGIQRGRAACPCPAQADELLTIAEDSETFSHTNASSHVRKSRLCWRMYATPLPVIPSGRAPNNTGQSKRETMVPPRHQYLKWNFMPECACGSEMWPRAHSPGWVQLGEKWRMPPEKKCCWFQSRLAEWFGKQWKEIKMSSHCTGGQAL